MCEINSSLVGVLHFFKKSKTWKNLKCLPQVALLNKKHKNKNSEKNF